MKTLVAAIIGSVALQPAAPQPFRSGIELVRLDVSVTRSGVPIAGLTAADFNVTDEGVGQIVESVSLENLPLSVQMVLDTSGSLSAEQLAHLLAAGEGLLAALKTGDSAGLMTFSDAVQARVAATRDLARVKASLAGIRGQGQTTLRDAVQISLAAPRDDAARGMILLFTDGVDSASWLTEEEVIDSARRAGIVIHVVRVQSADLRPTSMVEHLVDVTGGRVWSASSQRDLERLFTRALEEMRARYLVTFSPRGAGRNGWHEVKVRVRSSGAEVLARPGYFRR